MARHEAPERANQRMPASTVRGMGNDAIRGDAADATTRESPAERMTMRCNVCLCLSPQEVSVQRDDADGQGRDRSRFQNALMSVSAAASVLRAASGNATFDPRPQSGIAPQSRLMSRQVWDSDQDMRLMSAGRLFP